MVEEQPGLPDTVSAGAQLDNGLSVGALLAEARAAQGRELADLARETRVPLRHLMAIEADDHSALPALPYALGFVKAYARAVGLEPEAVGARFRAENRLVPHVPMASSLEPVDEAKLPSRGLAWGALALLVLVLGGLGLYGSGAFDPPADTAVVASSEPPPPAAPPATGPSATAAAPAAPAAAAAAAPAPPAGIPTSGPVVLVAREDVWLRITDPTSGRRVFMGVLSAGQSWTVPDGIAPVMRTGRAGVMEIRVAGVLLPPLGNTNQTIDGVVLAAPALAERFAGIALPTPQPAVQVPARPVPAQAPPA